MMTMIPVRTANDVTWGQSVPPITPAMHARAKAMKGLIRIEGMDGGGDTGALVESPLIGDYWMRADVHTKVAARQLGLAVRTTSDTTIYSLVTVRAPGAALEFRDYQSGVRVASRCESACRSATVRLS